MEEKTKDNEDVVLERSPEMNQMYVGHRKVKVWMGSRFQLFICILSQVHPLLTQQQKIESNYKLKDILILGESYFMKI